MVCCVECDLTCQIITLLIDKISILDTNKMYPPFILWNPVKQVTYVVAVGLAGKRCAVTVQSTETPGTGFNVLLETFPRKLTIIVSDDTLRWLFPGYQ